MDWLVCVVFDEVASPYELPAHAGPRGLLGAHTCSGGRSQEARRPLVTSRSGGCHSRCRFAAAAAAAVLEAPRDLVPGAQHLARAEWEERE